MYQMFQVRLQQAEEVVDLLEVVYVLQAHYVLTRGLAAAIVIQFVVLGHEVRSLQRVLEIE